MNHATIWLVAGVWRNSGAYEEEADLIRLPDLSVRSQYRQSIYQYLIRAFELFTETIRGAIRLQNEAGLSNGNDLAFVRGGNLGGEPARKLQT
jgi:hypothetical protein